MTHTAPVPLPSALLDHHAVDLEADSWGVTMRDVAVAASGEMYVLHSVHRHTYGVARDEADPAKGDFGYALISRYGGDGTVLGTAVSALGRYHRQDTAFGGSVGGLSQDLPWGRGLCALPGGGLAVTGQEDHTQLVAGDLSELTAHHGRAHGREWDYEGPSEPFVGWMSATPAGRLLCTTSEIGIYNYGSLLDSVVSLTDEPFTPAARPTLRALACLESDAVKQTEADVRPYVLFDGEPLGMDHRPRPSLVGYIAGLEGDDPRLNWYNARLHRPAVVREDVFVVPLFPRRGSRGSRFAFVLVSDGGEITGTLGGIDPYWESPYTGEHFEVVGDAVRGRVYHLNAYGLFAWTPDGELAQRIPLKERPFTALKQFTLVHCTPEGELVLAHRKQHVLLRVPCPDSLDDLGRVVEDALRAYGKERTALKKQWQPTGWNWVDRTAPVHRL